MMWSDLEDTRDALERGERSALARRFSLDDPAHQRTLLALTSDEDARRRRHPRFARAFDDPTVLAERAARWLPTRPANAKIDWSRVFEDARPARGPTDAELMIGYGIPEDMPSVLPFAFDGGGVFYAFDMREPPVDGEFPVVAFHASTPCWEEATVGAPTFEAACRGTARV